VNPAKRLVVTVQGWDGQCHQLVGRAAFMAAFLVAEAAHINAVPRGHVTFNFDGHALRPELHEAFPHVNTNET
jgi:hypothetical protein